jgi:hypothetical protein
MMSDDIKQLFNETKKVRIIWVELTSQSREALRKAVADKWYFPNCNMKENQSCHHVTLFFNPTPEEIKRITVWAKENDPIQMETDRLCHDSRIQAVVVTDVRAQDVQIAIPNKIPHVTICANVGVTPATSNDMLKNPQQCYPLKMHLDGILKFVY